MGNPLSDSQREIKLKKILENKKWTANQIITELEKFVTPQAISNPIKEKLFNVLKEISNPLEKLRYFQAFDKCFDFYDEVFIEPYSNNKIYFENNKEKRLKKSYLLLHYLYHISVNSFVRSNDDLNSTNWKINEIEKEIITSISEKSITKNFNFIPTYGYYSQDSFFNFFFEKRELIEFNKKFFIKLIVDILDRGIQITEEKIVGYAELPNGYQRYDIDKEFVKEVFAEKNKRFFNMNLKYASEKKKVRL